ncbi:MAG: ABC transporter permease [Gammaproteobacteria bacterium]|nr:ABC transporter permease [Gammaproteobacteria bacterium]
MPVLLWTDALVYLLVLSISAFIVYASKKEHFLVPWRQVIQHKLGMVSLVFLLVYVVIGLVDSVHFRLPVNNVSEIVTAENGAKDDTEDSNAQTAGQTAELQYDGDVLSLLDIVLTPIRIQEEKTYSAPFATHLFSKETVEHADGTRSREYPRLKYAGVHLDDPEKDWSTDILSKTAKGSFAGFIFWLGFVFILVGFIAVHRRDNYFATFKSMARSAKGIPWRLILITIGILCLLAGSMIELAPVYHVFGTDKVGQDVFYQTLKSIRTGLVIGTLTTLIMLPFAVLLGIMAGFLKGWVDDVIQYLYTTLSSIPGVLLIAAAVLMMQVYVANHPDLFETDSERADIRLFFLCVILGITSWTGLCRMLRGEAMKLREVDYVQASQAFGVSNFKIIWRHIQPNVMHIVLIAVVLDFSGLVLAEAVLSYVGVGVDPSMHSWGNLINGARLEMAREPLVWWSLLAAFIFMFVLVLSANLFSDAVRDAFDPRIRKQ